MNKKILIGLLVSLALWYVLQFNISWTRIKFFFVFQSVIVLGVLLGVLLPRRGADKDDPDSALDLPESSPWYGNEEIRIFREYLRIPTVHPNIDYGTIFLFKFQCKNDFSFIRAMCSIPETTSGKLRLGSLSSLSRK